MCSKCSKGAVCVECLERGIASKRPSHRETRRELARLPGLVLPRVVREMVPVRAETML